jgi:hypothetical protein
MPIASITYFIRAFRRLVRSPVSMKNDDPGFPGKIPVPRDAADPEPKPDSGRSAKAIFHFNGGERDIVGVFEHRNLAGAVEGDIEFARQSRQRTVVEDVIVPLPRV